MFCLCENNMGRTYFFNQRYAAFHCLISCLLYVRQEGRHWFSPRRLENRWWLVGHKRAGGETAPTGKKHAGCQTVESTAWCSPDCSARRFASRCKKTEMKVEVWGGGSDCGKGQPLTLPGRDGEVSHNQKGGTSDWVAVQSCETRRSGDIAALSPLFTSDQERGQRRMWKEEAQLCTTFEEAAMVSVDSCLPVQPAAPQWGPAAAVPLPSCRRMSALCCWCSQPRLTVSFVLVIFYSRACSRPLTDLPILLSAIWEKKKTLIWDWEPCSEKTSKLVWGLSQRPSSSQTNMSQTLRAAAHCSYFKLWSIFL